MTKINRPVPAVRRDSAETAGIRIEIDKLVPGTVNEATGEPLLEPVSFVIQAGEFVALMGPSGAGKTTLFNSLNGYERPFSGKVRFNGTDLHGEHYTDFAREIGFVPQKYDVVHGELTVFDALWYAALIRFPDETPRDKIKKRINEVLNELGLERIASRLVEKVSGGERKRVNLAVELLTEPSVLFLDEPTADLDAKATDVILKMLKKLAAEQGKTIVVTIHHLEPDHLHLFDQVAILAKNRSEDNAKGVLAYFGRPEAAADYFFGPSDDHAIRTPSEIMRELCETDRARYWQEKCKNHLTRIPDRRVMRHGVARRGSTSVIQQWWALVCRDLLIRWMDTKSSILLMMQAPLSGCLLWLVFGDQLQKDLTAETWPQVSRALGTALFWMTQSAIWFGVNNAIREIVRERAIYERERMVNLSIGAYVASKFTVLGGLGVLQCFILLSFTYHGCYLQSSVAGLFALLLLAVSIGIAIGLIISAAVRRSEAALALLPIVLPTVAIIGGVMQPIESMSRPAQWVSVLNPARWCFEGMFLLESEQRPTFDDMLPANVRKSEQPKDMAEYNFPRAIHRTSPGKCIFALSIILTLCVCALLVVLHRDRRSLATASG